MQDISAILARLAVIESRLKDLTGHLQEIRRLIPERLVEHSEKLATLERIQRSLVWGMALVVGGLLSAFIAHIVKG